MGWRDFHISIPSDFVDFVDISPGSTEESQQSQQSQLKENLENKPDGPAGLQEAIELYRKQGWVKIFSTYLKTELYLIRDKSVKVPDLTIPKYTQAEVDALGDLNLDELRTMHQAKVIFKGTIHRGGNHKMDDV